MDKEIVKELEKMILENKYTKTLDFLEVRCSKCINSLSEGCSLHTKDKINISKEVLVNSLPDEQKNKNVFNVFTNSKIVEHKFFIQKEDILEKHNIEINRIKLDELVDLNCKKSNDDNISEMEFSFDDVFE